MVLHSIREVWPIRRNTHWPVLPKYRCTSTLNVFNKYWENRPNERPLKHYTRRLIRNATLRSPSTKAPGHDRIIFVQPLLKALLRKAVVFLRQIYNSMLRIRHSQHEWKWLLENLTKKSNDRYEYYQRFYCFLPSGHLAPLFPKTQMESGNFNAALSWDTILNTYKTKGVCLNLFRDTEKLLTKYGILVHCNLSHICLIVHSYLDRLIFCIAYQNALSIILYNFIGRTPE